jgi:hypothetical protein
MAVAAQIGGGLVEPIAVAVGACDLADVLLVSDCHPHITPLGRHVRSGVRTIAEPARDKRDAACCRERDRYQRQPSLHRAPSG